MSDIVNIFAIPSSTSSVLSAVMPPLTTFVTAIVAVALGATIFKWYESWHNAEVASRALSGLTRNFARHCIYNMSRIAQIYIRPPSEFPSDTLLKKQRFVLSVVSEATRDRMHLIGTKLIFRLEALFLRLRNFNIEIDFVLKNKTANNDINKVLDYIFLKNMQLAERSHNLADEFDKLIEDSKKMPYWRRFYYIFRDRGTIFNDNDFPPGPTKKLDRLFSRPSISTVDSILKTYLEDEGSEKKEYEELIKTYKRIYEGYPGDLREWFGEKWTT